jgi:hypothetical protein
MLRIAGYKFWLFFLERGQRQGQGEGDIRHLSHHSGFFGKILKLKEITKINKH